MITPEAVDALVIGAGPAGLMAAEALMAPGRRVVVAEAMPSPARKLLMAGKSGLNLTRDEPMDAFAARIAPGAHPPPGPHGYLWSGEGAFGPQAVRDWAGGLGIALFAGSTGRVFPKGMKASPLLRAWLSRLAAGGVDLRPRWRWTALEAGPEMGSEMGPEIGALTGLETQRGFRFATPDGARILQPRVAVLALGGASWPRLGSDAGWVPILAGAGVPVAPFRPANMGFRVAWSPAMARHVGQPVKGVALRAGSRISRGEWVITPEGIEGGGVYALSAALRDGQAGLVDLAPDLEEAALAARFAQPRGRLSLGNWLRRVLGDPVRVALLLEWGRPWPQDAQGWAARAKALPLDHAGPMGLERAISSAGGIEAPALTPELELRALPGTFACGEMLDWEAQTGGYLLTACLATGLRAGRAAALRLAPSGPV